MKDTIRAFIAIELDDPVKNILRRVQKTLGESGADVKWTDPQNIHLTLNFLGDVPFCEISTITKVMEQAVQGIPSFPISITEVGAFPDILLPRILWAGITGNEDKLLRIAQRLEDGPTRLKIKKEDRKFSAHITLGRVRSFQGKDRLCAALEETSIPENLVQTVDHIALIQSELTPQRPVYTLLNKTPLPKKESPAKCQAFLRESSLRNLTAS